MRATVAGELALRASFAKGKEKAELELREASYTAQVTAGTCSGMFDMVPLAQSADAGMRLMVYARDAYGNLDETCESTVTATRLELRCPRDRRACCAASVVSPNASAEASSSAPRGSQVVVELDAISQEGVALGERSVTFSHGVAEISAAGV